MKIKNNIHPGEILLEEFLRPLDLTAYKLAKSICVQQTRISQVINGKRSVTADTAMRLAKYFGTTPEFWMNLQLEYDLRCTKSEKGADIDKIIPLHSDKENLSH